MAHPTYPAGSPLQRADSQHFLATIPYIFILAVVYFAAARFGLSMAYEAEQVTVVWPPTGIALAALLIRGKHLWPGIMIGAFAANIMTSAPVAAAAGIAIGNTLEAVVGVWLLRRLGFDNTMMYVRDVLGLVICAAGLSTMISATIGVTSLCVMGVQPWEMYTRLWLVWWVGDATGALLVAPFLLVWARAIQRPRLPRRRLLELAALAFALFVVSVLVFTDLPAINNMGRVFIYIIFPFIITGALRFEQHGTTLVALIASSMAIWPTMHGAGPFVTTSVSQGLLLLQSFMAVAAITGLLLGAAIAERRMVGGARSLLAAIVESSEDAIVSKTLDGIITFWNRGAERIFGYRASEMIGESITKVIPLDRRQEEINILNNLRAGKHIEHFETVRVSKDGRLLDISLTISPIRDENGRIIGASKIARDITRQKEAERAFRHLADAMPQIVWITNPEGYVEYFNSRWYEYTGLSKEESLGDKWSLALHPDDRRHVIESWQQSVHKGAVYDVEYRFRNKEGQYRWFLARGVPVRDKEGKIIQWFGTCTDIHDKIIFEQELRLAKEKAESASLMKSEFLANMSHEIRTPMNAVVGLTNILRTTQLTGRQHEFVSTLQTSAESLMSLINDMLDFAKIESNKIEFEHIAFKPTNLIKECTRIISVEAHKKGLELVAEESCDPGMELIGDPYRIRQIIMNLLSNAVKFTEHGVITVKLDCSVASGELIDITVIVNDTGIGISEEIQKAIFDKFTQGDASTTRKYGGTGLGLAISKSLAELMGGSISVESRLGKGSRFTMKLTLKKAGAAHPALVKSDTAGKKQSQKTGNPPILLVEDYEANILVATTLLEEFGYEYEIAHNGMEALKLMENNQFSLVLMDVQMQGMDGYEATRRIREREQKSGKHVPIIAMTAYALGGDKEKCLQAGMDDYISKPFNPKQLEEKIARHLKRDKLAG